MSARQQAALASRLARAANSVSDSSLRAALHQAASSLAYNDPHTASSALQQAASALAQSRSAAGAKAALQKAGGQLDSLKNQVSGLNNAEASSGQSGTPIGKGAPVPGGQGQNGATGPNGKGGLGSSPKGGLGTGRGNGRTSGAGQGRGLGRGPSGGGTQGTGGPGGSGGHGTGGGNGGAGPHGRGRYATVYTPFAQQGKGPQTTEQGPTGAPLPGSLSPYQAVLQHYSSSAHQALSQTSLPPSLQQYVRSYFSAISH
jgi:hypothetical protein